MRTHGRSVAAMLIAVLAAVALAACGGSSKSAGGGTSSDSGATKASSDPQTLLKQTFSSTHTVKSGVLDISFTIDPKGSSVISTPLSLAITGPFNGEAPGKVPQVDLTFTAKGLNKTGTFGFVTTSDAAYARLQGTAYKLPASTLAKLRAGVAKNGSSGSAPGLSSLGIDPSHWLTSPTTVGTETLDGTQVQHVRAGVDVNAMLADINTVLAKQSSSSGGTAPSIPAATMKKIAAAIKNPTVDVWAGKDDSELRRLTLTANVPVSGEISTRLGGMTSASFRIDAHYTKLNQPQTISAPANPRSYAELQSKIQQLGQQLGGALSGSLGGTTGSSGSSSSGSGSTGSSGSTSPGAGIPSARATAKYSKCVNAAGGDVTKIQKCGALLRSGG